MFLSIDNSYLVDYYSQGYLQRLVLVEQGLLVRYRDCTIVVVQLGGDKNQFLEKWNGIDITIREESYIFYCKGRKHSRTVSLWFI